MTDQILNHPAIPEGSVHVKARSAFGQQLGFVHYFNERLEKQQLYYLGLQLQEKHGGAPGRGHGGVTMTVLDEVMGRAASRCLGKLCFTASMTTHFCAGSKVGDFLLATAKIDRRGKNLVFVSAELHANEKLIATATGTWINSGQAIPDNISSDD